MATVTSLCFVRTKPRNIAADMISVPHKSKLTLIWGFVSIMALLIIFFTLHCRRRRRVVSSEREFDSLEDFLIEVEDIEETGIVEGREISLRDVFPDLLRSNKSSRRS